MKGRQESPISVHTRATGHHQINSGVFVGRETELSFLRTAAEEALGGRGRVLLLAGEAGIGKTRTAQELARYAQQHGMQVLWGRGHEGPRPSR
jgi:predicted ATP-dependent serine protease